MKDILKSLFIEGGALRVRSILAFVIGGVYAYLAIEGEIPTADIKEITLLVIGFYFISAAARK